jgi:hypothetical protein
VAQHYTATNIKRNIAGTWSPAVNNTATTTYTFTPSGSACATTAQLTVTVTPQVTPTFDPIGPVCSGSTITLPQHQKKILLVHGLLLLIIQQPLLIHLLHQDLTCATTAQLTVTGYSAGNTNL